MHKANIFSLLVLLRTTNCYDERDKKNDIVNNITANELATDPKWSKNNELNLVNNLVLNRLKGTSVAAYVGSTITVVCNRPTMYGEKTVWMYSKSIDTIKFRPMEVKVMGVENCDLTIYYVRSLDAGVYRCKVGSFFGDPVVLDVLDDEDKYNVAEVEGNLNTTDEIFQSDAIETILRVFPDGVHCRSMLLPNTVKELNAISRRNNEIMIGLCKVPCTSDVFELRTNTGEVLERANNSEGVYSLCQREPAQPPPVTRGLLFAVVGKRVVVKCPGTTLRDIPANWRIGTKAVVPKTLDAESKGRVHFNARDHIVIEEAKLSETNVYSCWQGDNLAGVIQLQVYEDARSKYSERVFLGLMLLCLIIMFRWTESLYAYQRRNTRL